MHDANGNMMEILDLHLEIVGGARSETIGNEPISSHGRSLAFAPSSLAKDKREEYGIKTSASTLAFVEPVIRTDCNSPSVILPTPQGAIENRRS